MYSNYDSLSNSVMCTVYLHMAFLAVCAMHAIVLRVWKKSTTIFLSTLGKVRGENRVTLCFRTQYRLHWRFISHVLI